MAGYADSTVTILKTLQVILASSYSYVNSGGFVFPNSTPIDTIVSTASYNYIIVGAGEAGSVMAYRLAETGATILLIEEGGRPPYESMEPGFFTMLPLSNYDAAYDIYNDNYTCQNLKPDGGATSGKMLGGSSAINHMMYIPPTPNDYDSWAAAGDSTWGFPDFGYYFAKTENIQDEGVLAQNTSRHGTCGPTKLKKQESPLTEPVINAYTEMGSTYKNDSYGKCHNQPLLTIGDNMRQSGATSYLSKIMSKTNVHVISNAVASKILFTGTKATGVELIFSGSTYKVSATSKVILSAGAIKSPQILMLSGIGNADTLAELGITSVVNNPEVGQNLMDHVACVFGVALDEATASTASADPHDFPAPMVTAYDTANDDDTVIQRQDIVLYFPPASGGLLQLCTYGFKYLDAICDAWYEYNLKRNFLFVVTNLMHPLSRGSVGITSTDVTDKPTIKLNLYGVADDLETFAALAMKAGQIVNTTALQNLGAEFADIGVCSEYDIGSLEFWKCYTLIMSSTMWHYSGTNMMGKVTDSTLSVIGTTNLKVVDASVMPGLPSGNIASAVRALAEKAADIIKTEDGYTVETVTC